MPHCHLLLCGQQRKHISETFWTLSEVNGDSKANKTLTQELSELKDRSLARDEWHRVLCLASQGLGGFLMVTKDAGMPGRRCDIG